MKVLLNMLRPSSRNTKVSLTITSVFLLLLLSSVGQAKDKAPAAETLRFSEIKPTSDQVSVVKGEDDTASGVVFNTTANTTGYPGVSLLPENGESWDLSGFGNVEVQLTNQSEGAVYAIVRVDNEGSWEEKPWNSEPRRIKANDTVTIRVYFGYSHGKPAFKLNPAAVTRLMIFTPGTKQKQSIRIDSIKASRAVKKVTPYTKPVNGYVYGGDAEFDPSKQLVKRNGAKIQGGSAGQPLKVTFSGKGQSIYFRPAEGLWDFREAYQVVLKIKNAGSSASTVSAQVGSKGKKTTEKVTIKEPLLPGKSIELTIPFMPAKGKLAGDKNKFESNKVGAINVFSADSGGEQVFEIESIVANAPPIKLPDWVGKRPPVDGDWIQTYNEEFEGDAIDYSKWNVYTSNFWDKTSHFSKNNVLVEDGKAILRYEHKTGYHNDDPARKKTKHATGFLSTYGKWVQRYGYFEARMKLPGAPGLWPAFWLMPDRGIAAGEQWRRANTKDGAMEFDIMEFLSGWGTYRFTTAFHWDGYDDDHKITGASVYTAHDEEGYVTTGLLWLPGLAVIYNNGVEVVRWETDRISNVQSYIIFTYVSGGWDNLPIDNAQLPDDFVVDYVRCWQRADLASDVDGVQSTQATLAAPTTPDA